MTHEELGQKQSLLLHSCCGPCSTAVIERLISRFHLTVFFYNPNITEAEEYEKRKETQIRFLKDYNATLQEEEQVAFLEAKYDPERYFELVKGLESEPEGGARCVQCFRMRLSQAAETAGQNGFDCYATTLSVSPHKNFSLIAQIGAEMGDEYGISFLAEDFKKKAGYQRSVALSKQFDLYRQNFCGCVFTKNRD